jgi:hypothetical protein
MSLVNINGSEILVKSVEIYGSGLVQTTAQTGVAPPAIITAGGYNVYSNTIAGSAAVNPNFIQSQAPGFLPGGNVYMINLSYQITTTSNTAPTPANGRCSLNLSSSQSPYLEQINVGIATNWGTLWSPGVGDGSALNSWSDNISFLMSTSTNILDPPLIIEFGLTAVGYDAAETFNCDYQFSWCELNN